jgi:hypothetical protein
VRGFSAHYQSIQDETEEGKSGPVVLPAQEGIAAATQSHTPGKAAKPREFRRGRAAGVATVSLPEAADVEHEAMGIHAPVVVTPVDTNSLVFARYPVAADRADDPPFGSLSDLVFGVGFYAGRRTCIAVRTAQGGMCSGERHGHREHVVCTGNDMAA